MAHTHNNEALNAQIEEISKKLKTAERTKIQSETQLETLKNDYRKVEKEIKDSGVEPAKAEETLKGYDDEIEKLLSEINELLPVDMK